ncbi:uncharacterized protein LOC106661736 isoform X2 [Cimex lectularius]|uniref:C3H1-type domain-containing protein n=1 Tax=Cimex lectularius TaxID=79782 RepID=A0A8I6R911_CIMLE|nr:uncharacterized protein LOC106661736 isoform X2 [Cimex lectularius]
MMALSTLTEDFTSSDDYEEGEILDEDSLYDDISSLEDLSLSDSEPRQVDVSVAHKKRKKEHKCKDGSVCRGERSGKHCFARIRKRRLSPEYAEKMKTPDHTYYRGLDEGKILDKKPTKRIPNQSKYIGRKLNKKDQFVKEGYHFHKQKNYDYYKEKTRPFRNGDNQWYENDHKSKHKQANAKMHNSFVSSAKPAKTSLLKRLVGSGSMVAKKEGNAERSLLPNENKKGKETISDYVENMKPSEVKSDDNCPLKYDVTDKQSDNNDIKELTGEIEKSKSEKAQSKPKSEELNEWDLRIAALRTALLKKFSEKKKNGLSFKRKCSNPSDDSIVDYALQDFVENEMEFPEKVEVLKDVDYRQFSDQQPCDMEFCEMQPVQHGFNSCIFTEKNPIPFSESDFDCRVYSCYPFPQGKMPNSGQKHLSPFFSPPLNSDQEQLAIVPGSSVSSAEDKSQPVPECLKEINSNNISNQKNSFKKKRRKINKLENRKLKKSLEPDRPILAKMDVEENEKETTEEEELRELALMSVKVKNKMPQGMLVKVNPDNELLKTLHVDTSHTPAANSDSSSNKPISNNSSRDPWDDVDEDILRAQLLSSMSNKIPTKINSPTESISPNIIPPVKKAKNTLKMNGLKMSKANINPFINASELMRMKENKSFYNHKRFIKKNKQVPLQISAPAVQKLVINLNDSDTSEEDCSPHIAASIDLFLQEVRSKTEREQEENAMLEVIKVEEMAPEPSNDLLQVSEAKVLPNADTKVKIEKPELLTNGKISLTLKNSNDSQSSEIKTPTSKSTLPSATPQGIKHLPAWQQEEYRRLKNKLIEKERMWNSVELKIQKVKKDELKAQVDSVKTNNCKRDKPFLSLSPSNVNKGRTPENAINQTDTVDSGTETSRKRQCLNNNTAAKESWQYYRDFSELSSMVEGLEKDLEEFQALKSNTARLRRELALAQNKMSMKRMSLVSTKESLEKKEKYINSKLTLEFQKLKKTEIPDQENFAFYRQRSKEFELAFLKLKEISLRAQLACFNLAKELKPAVKSAKTVSKETSSPMKKKVKTPLPKDSVPVENNIKLEATNSGDNLQGGNNQKRVFSVSESGSLDPFTPLCPFDMAGVCKDEECKYQHIRPT